MPDTTVVYFRNGMSSAPTLQGVDGSLITLLDACLVNGFGTVTVTSLVVANNVATVTVSGGHNLTMIGPITGPVIEIAGATPSGLNGRWRAATIPSSTTLTFATTGIADQTATGTITLKRASAGWAKLYSGTNKAVYQRPGLRPTSMLLRVNDGLSTETAKFASLVSYETMSNVDTGTGATNTVYLYKSSTLNSTNRDWMVFADDCAVYVFAAHGGNYTPAGIFWGDLAGKATTDAYGCALIGGWYSSEEHTYRLGAVFNGWDAYLQRPYTQTGGGVNCLRASGQILNSSELRNFSYSQLIFPPQNGLFLADPIRVFESVPGSIHSPLISRGYLPGASAPLYYYSYMNGWSFRFSTPTKDYLGATVHEGRFAMDVTGAWR